MMSQTQTAISTAMLLVLPMTSAVITGQPKKPAGGFGFGAQKPKTAATLKDTVRTFKTRLPKDAGVPCPCGAGAAYSECCRPYHVGEKLAETPEWCLRSRYVAFAYRLPAYIIETTDRSNSDFMKDKVAWAKKLNKGSMFDQFEFVSLEVGEVQAGATDDEVFLSPNKFTLQPKDALGSPPLVMQERTKFVRRKDAWLFASGTVTSEAAGFKGQAAWRILTAPLPRFLLGVPVNMPILPAQVLENEKSVNKLKKDVDYVTSLLDKAKKRAD